MFDTIASTRSAMEELAASFEPGTLTHDQAVQVVHELGVIRRLTEGVLATAAKRVADTAPCRKGATHDAAHAYARAAGVETSEARRAITMAKRLEHLPATEAAVREGRLSTREAQMIAEAATVNPTVEPELLEAAAQGIVPLKDDSPTGTPRPDRRGGRGTRGVAPGPPSRALRSALSTGERQGAGAWLPQ
jgi:Domain of unknown function (DUF222)